MTKWLGLLILLLTPLCTLAGGEPDSLGSSDPVDPANDLPNGRRIYEQYCASCHGVQGEGAENWKQRNEVGELPPPPHDETGHTWRHGDSMLFRMISQGWRDPFNKTDHLTMPAFGDELTDDEIKAVIDYLKTLWTDDQRQYQARESRGT